MITIRTATPDDAKELLAIYAPYVTETAITFEYVPPTVEEFRERITNTLKKFPYLVAEEDGIILGYTYASTFRVRPAFNHCVEMSIYIDKNQRRKGVGRLLYKEIEDHLRKLGKLNLNASIATVDFPDDNLTPDSERFHETFGYKKVGHFHKCGYKFGKWYDMIWMEKMIGDHCV